VGAIPFWETTKKFSRKSTLVISWHNLGKV